ncbi:MAG TPA: SH3 domain-containing protein [Caulobacteraceae bacterium]
MVGPAGLNLGRFHPSEIYSRVRAGDRVAISIAAGAATVVLGMLVLFVWLGVKAMHPSSVTYYATRRTNVRDAPTSSGSLVIGAVVRGERLSGEMVKSPDGTTAWLKEKLPTGANGYIWAKNLSPQPRPGVVNAAIGKYRSVSTIAVHAEPSAASPVIGELQQGEVAEVAGTVAGGWQELALKGGGVGYVLVGGPS